jgi:hypothetical protein
MQEFQVLRVLEPTLRMKAQVDSSSRGRKIVEKRSERLHGGECMRTWKPVVLWVMLEIGFL